MSYEIAHKYLNRGVPLEDLVQSGYEGILIAHDKYQESMGTKFSTYARYWILKMIYQTVNDEGRAIRFPDWYRNTRMVPVMETQTLLFQKLNREPLSKEIADELGWEVSDVESALHWGTFSPVEFDAEDSTLEIIDKVEAGDPEIQLEQVLLKKDIAKLLRLLPKIEADVLRRRFGFGREEQTLRQIATELNISIEGIRKIEGRALQRLRRDPDARPTISIWKDS
ncbi:MAG: sigma-70 family RNA polymerase sigma factor [Bacteroidetes bacterium]|nr:sigma-70 family RNA polymerase sigma factor [Bacteroidota bacterium]